MAVFSIAFDLKPQRDNAEIINAIKNYEHEKAYDTYWYISTKEELTPTQLYNRFSDFITEKDFIVIQKVFDLHVKTYQNTLDWLKERLER